MSSKVVHKLNIISEDFSHIERGNKTFLVRENDRGFQSGDLVVLIELLRTVKALDTKNNSNISYYEEYTETKNQIVFKIGYVLPISQKRVVFSLLKE